MKKRHGSQRRKAEGSEPEKTRLELRSETKNSRWQADQEHEENAEGSGEGD